MNHEPTLSARVSVLELDLSLARAAGLPQKVAEIAAELSRARQRLGRCRRQQRTKHEVGHAR